MEILSSITTAGAIIVIVMLFFEFYCDSQGKVTSDSFKVFGGFVAVTTAICAIVYASMSLYETFILQV